jgi:DNA-binding transcriptional MerR regulator
MYDAERRQERSETMLGARETAYLCDIPFRTVRDWVKKQVLVPAIWGRTGYDNGHRLSNRQAIALAFMGWLREEFGGYLGPQYVKDLMLRAEQCDEAAIDRLIRGEPDAWQEEMLAALRALSPTLEEVPESLARRLARVIQAIRRKEEYRPGHNRMRRRQRRRV